MVHVQEIKRKVRCAYRRAARGVEPPLGLDNWIGGEEDCSERGARLPQRACQGALPKDTARRTYGNQNQQLGRGGVFGGLQG